jgi:hypothetical protein
MPVLPSLGCRLALSHLRLCDSEWDIFYKLWSERFRESQNVLEAGNDFCGVSYEDGPDGTLLLSCDKLLQALGVMIQPFEPSAPCLSPMHADMLVLMRIAKSTSNPAHNERLGCQSSSRIPHCPT